MIKHYFLVAVPLGLLALTGCIGGGSGAQSTPTPIPTPTPSPSPSPTPIPTPTPTPTPLPTLPLSTSASFDAITGTWVRNGNTETGTVAERTSRVSISFDAAANTYTVQDETGTATFGAADRQTSSDYTEVYSKPAGVGNQELRIYGNIRVGAAAGTPPVQLSYVSYGVWTHRLTAQFAQPAHVRQTFALIGFPTPTAEMPLTGTASYATTVAALRSDDGATGSVAGTASFSANFATNGVSTQLMFPGRSPYVGTGTISANQFTGAFSSAEPFFVNGVFVGGFFGPVAREMGYAFSLYHYNPDPYAGASVVPMRTWFNGVVLGAKQ